jgi:hypothetical protein
LQVTHGPEARLLPVVGLLVLTGLLFDGVTSLVKAYFSSQAILIEYSIPNPARMDVLRLCETPREVRVSAGGGELWSSNQYGGAISRSPIRFRRSPRVEDLLAGVVRSP